VGRSAAVVRAHCRFTGNQLLGGVGAVFEVTCPSGCAAGASVWGAGPYADESEICAAGIHAGAIPLGGGALVVRLEPSQVVYRGGARNGVTSSDHGREGRSSFTVAPQGHVPPAAPEAIQATCGFAGRDIRDADGTAHLVSCPPICAGKVGLWGTDVYSGDSSVCRAAIHAGLVSATAGGEVVVILDGAQPAFRGSLRNGVWSGQYGKFPSSFYLQAARH
jgi:hypothetical protein